LSKDLKFPKIKKHSHSYKKILTLRKELTHLGRKFPGSEKKNSLFRKKFPHSGKNIPILRTGFYA
jgi:hypothetical protein